MTTPARMRSAVLAFGGCDLVDVAAVHGDRLLDDKARAMRVVVELLCGAISNGDASQGEVGVGEPLRLKEGDNGGFVLFAGGIYVGQAVTRLAEADRPGRAVGFHGALDQAFDLNVAIGALEVADACAEQQAAEDQADRQKKTKSYEGNEKRRTFLLRHGRTTSVCPIHQSGWGPVQWSMRQSRFDVKRILKTVAKRPRSKSGEGRFLAAPKSQAV